MELGEAREVRTTCPYCGVGCGVLAKVAAGGEFRGPGGPHPPAHIGRRWCHGSGQAATLDRDGRG
ncbi:hypothetical protein, partial [Mesorhizobium sp. M0586]|uniref:hypothetical protein n=1 Tax=Mesorhizobium sp. M0586 TaxID=2956963 RepID=UPI0033388E06